ncbi:hypothetical protein GUA87_00130 [Sneathiella sp. P13V-1]|uniref:hypothetical protein n=1 Tax=Sneathiella sp. P13V-1 TaxID=2697366 RepID=UPI00187B9944|nr:hypothetical protein [Sneathiella sp. P13V-1]MBE7635235.1 hypothetical protein [Sneathiella sp. P13V-1]
MKLRAFVVSVLSLALLSGAAMAKGEWQKVQNRKDCEIWNPNPLEEEKVYWTVGGCVDGKAHGRGVLVWEYWDEDKTNIDTYIGWMKQGVYQGQGHSVYEGGTQRKGLFDKGKQFYGYYYYKNGDVYYGEMKKGILEGEGKLTFAKGGWYKGKFKGGKRHGEGEMLDHRGDRFKGEFENNEPHGIVSVTFANDVKFRGFFNDGYPDGYGEMIFPSGAVCGGNFGRGYTMRGAGKAHNKENSNKGTCEKEGSTTHFTWD